MGAIASQITSLTIVYSTVYSDADQRKHQSSASLAFLRIIHRGRVNSPHKWPVTRKMFPFDDVMMNNMDGIDTPIQVTMVADITNHYLIIRINWKNEQVITKNHIVKKKLYTPRSTRVYTSTSRVNWQIQIQVETFLLWHLQNTQALHPSYIEPNIT